MLLHDSYFHSMKYSINETYYNVVIMAYSSLFHSTLTLVISIFGLIFNLICSIKIWSIIRKYRQRKLRKSVQQSPQESGHVLSHNKYAFILVLTSNDFLLCLSSIISCLDETYFYQSFLARYHLCSASILLWKFALHFIPLLIVSILCRYHYILKKDFQIKFLNLSALTQLFCTNLSILIAFVLALAWSVDGLWLWGVANIKDFFISEPAFSNYTNHTNGLYFVANGNMSSSLEITNQTSNSSKKMMYQKHHLAQQENICYLQTINSYNFTVRLVYLIQADLFLVLLLHLTGFILEIALLFRLCRFLLTTKYTSAHHHEKQICIYIIFTFMILTVTSLPFYIFRTIEMVSDAQFPSIYNDFINSRSFAQILLCGVSFKPFLFMILFIPSSIIFKMKCYLKCYSPMNIEILEDDEQIFKSMKTRNSMTTGQEPSKYDNRTRQHRYSLLMRSTSQPKLHTRTRAQSHPTAITAELTKHSSPDSQQYQNWLKLTHDIISNLDNEDRSNIVYV